MNKKNVWVPIVVGVACAIVFFFVGMAYGKGSAAAAGTTTRRAGLGGAYASSTHGGFGAGGGFVVGQISSVASTSITVQLANGNSEIVFYSNSTPIVKPEPADASALTVGSQVMIGGTTNSDGSVTASTIQIRNGSGAGFGAGAGGSASGQ